MLVNVGLKVASKVVKEIWEQGTHDWHEGSNICEGLFRSMMGFKVTSKDFVNEMWYAYAKSQI